MAWMKYSPGGAGWQEAWATGVIRPGQVEIMIARTRFERSEASASILANLDWERAQFIPVIMLSAFDPGGEEILAAARSAARLEAGQDQG